MDLRAYVPGLLISAAALFISPVCYAAPLMVEKNLFAQDRKPPSNEPAPAAAQSNKPALPPKSIQLDGIVVYGDTRKALIRIKGQLPGDDRRKGGSPYVSVGEGDKVGGYQVTKIDSQSILIERDGETYEVRLFAEGKVVPPPPPMPTSPDSAPQQGGQPGQPAGGTPGGRMAGQPNQPTEGHGNVPRPDVGRNAAPGMPPGNGERPLIGVSPDDAEQEEEIIMPEEGEEEVYDEEAPAGEEE